MPYTLLKRLSFAGILLFGMLPAAAQAHVKWFSDYSLTDQPLTFGEAITPTFIGLMILSVVTIAALVFVDKLLSKVPLYVRIEEWLEERRKYSDLVMRIAVGATLLLSWQADSLLVPDLPLPMAWLGWVQFVLVILLIFPRTTPIAGLGLIGLYFAGIIDNGAFYMLDYLLYLGAGFFLFVSQSENPKRRELGLPALYATVGFSLCWVALEKLIYPQWSNYILQQNPQLTLGFANDFFRQSASFVEFALGFLLIICLLQRPLSLVITLVFFTTTLIFGKQEIIGHTIIHGALIVFLLEGPGEIYRAPITFPKTQWARAIFAAVSFVALLFVLLVPYSFGANTIYDSLTEDESASVEGFEALQRDVLLGQNQ